MAPRVHNSGHWTNEGANISQFEAHVMAIADINIKNISINGNSAMLNIISKMPENILINDNYKLYKEIDKLFSLISPFPEQINIVEEIYSIKLPLLRKLNKYLVN